MQSKEIFLDEDDQTGHSGVCAWSTAGCAVG